MNKIRFIVDYRGVLTGEKFYQVGDVAELSNAAALVDEGRAEFVKADPLPPPVDKPAPKRRTRKKATK